MKGNTIESCFPISYRFNSITKHQVLLNFLWVSFPMLFSGVNAIDKLKPTLSFGDAKTEAAKVKRLLYFLAVYLKQVKFWICFTSNKIGSVLYSPKYILYVKVHYQIRYDSKSGDIMVNKIQKKISPLLEGIFQIKIQAIKMNEWMNECIKRRLIMKKNKVGHMDRECHLI